MSTMTRTDIHSPSNFDPAEYEYVGSFDAWPEPGTGPCPEWEMIAMRALNSNPFEGGNWQGKGTCDHCGARIRYVTVWAHTSGVHIATGDTCASERFDLPSRVAFEQKILRGRAAAAREAAALVVKVTEFLSDHPGLEEALTTDHYIIRDLAASLKKWGSLSDKQTALAFKLAREAAERAVVREAEVNVPAPEGRVTFEGVVVSIKSKDTDFGLVWKMTVKVTDEIAGGVWLAWLTQPASLAGTERGDTVRMTATLTRGNEPHFAFGKRPAKAVNLGKLSDADGEEDSLS